MLLLALIQPQQSCARSCGTCSPTKRLIRSSSPKYVQRTSHGHILPGKRSLSCLISTHALTKRSASTHRSACRWSESCRREASLSAGTSSKRAPLSAWTRTWSIVIGRHTARMLMIGGRSGGWVFQRNSGGKWMGTFWLWVYTQPTSFALCFLIYI